MYTLLGGTPAYTPEQLRTLARIRDTFGARHPQAAIIAALLDQLTAGLSDTQRAIYRRHQTQRVPLDPAIDYTPAVHRPDRASLAGHRPTRVAQLQLRADRSANRDSA